MADQIIKWPFGEAETIALTATGAQALTVRNNMTIVDGVAVQATGNRTLNLTIAASVTAGALMLVKSKTAATETTAFGTGMQGATITGVAGTTVVAYFVYDGTSFVAVNVQGATAAPVVAETIELTATGAQAITVAGAITIIDGVTVPATDNRTLNLTIGEGVAAGARMLVKSKTAATETTVLGTGMQGVTITGEAGKTIVAEFVYDGTNFVESGTPIKID